MTTADIADLANPHQPIRVARLGPWIAISLLFHALLLLLHFAFPEAEKRLRAQALEVVLVNQRSAEKPSEAQALAQANLNGGGEVEAPRRAASPLPASAQAAVGEQLRQAQRRVQAYEAKQRELLAKASPAVRPEMSQQAVPQPQPSPSVSGLDLAESARAMARVEGEIARQVEAYNQRPRKKFIGSRTEEYRFATYVEAWRSKVERIGTLNYPAAARGKLSGTLVMTVALNAAGEVISITLNRPSGVPVIDDAARQIVQMGSPYAAFPPDIRRDVDVLEITRTWTFTNSNEVRSN